MAVCIGVDLSKLLKQFAENDLSIFFVRLQNDNAAVKI